jgi:GTPase SAR1 family protein
MTPMKLMTLGYSNVGKTYFLGSLFKLSYDIGANGFSVQSKVFNQTTDIQTVFGIVSGVDQTKTVSTTVDIRSSSMVLKKGLDDLIDIEVTDIEGQALEPDRNVEVAEKILNKIVDYDGLLLVLEAPQNEAECEIAKQHLGQMLNFSGKALNRNEKIPITLVINKIDRLNKTKDIRRQVDDEIAMLKADLMKKYPGNVSRITREMKFREGTIVNKYVKDAVNSFEIFDICETFFNFIRNTSLSVPCKVFLSTSFGFGCASTDDIDSFIGENKLYKPYGSGASFLWTIYARLKSQSIAEFDSEQVGMSLEELSRGLLEDITELHSRGRSYFDPENNDTGNIWSLRNISSLRTGIDG